MKDKLDPKQIPFLAVKSILEVRKFGNRKYEPNSFYLVPAEQHLDATIRHLMEVYIAQDITVKDLESGLMHIEHALTDLAGVVEIIKRQENNR